MKILTKRPAFTLIEMLLYIGLSSIVFVVALRTMITVMESRQRMVANTEVQQSLRLALNQLVETSLNADGINIGASAFGVPQGILSFSMSDPARNPTVFSLINGQIQMKSGTQSFSTVTSPAITVDQFRIVNVTPLAKTPTLRLELHAVQSGALVAGKNQEMSLTTSLTLRR